MNSTTTENVASYLLAGDASFQINFTVCTNVSYLANLLASSHSSFLFNIQASSAISCHHI